MTFIEETIILKDTKLEEINKYYIQDNINEVDKINYILKKGYPCQKENFIKNIHQTYIATNSPSFVYSIIKEIINNIEVYDKNLQMEFAFSLGVLAEKLPFISVKGNSIEDNKNMIRMILLHFIKAISTLEKTVSDRYIISFNKIIEYYHQRQFRLSSLNEIIEYVVSLGKFGQISVNRRFSAYFCVCIIRISLEKSPDLYKRIIFLCDDSERVVRYEVGYQIRFVLSEESNDKEYIKEKFTPVLLSYLTEETDIVFKSTILESLLLNITKFEKQFIDILLKKIDGIFSTEDFYTISIEFSSFIQIFVNLLKVASEYKDYRVDLVPLITKFLKKYLCFNELQNSTNVTATLQVDYSIINFDKIAKVYIEENSIVFLNQLIYLLFRFVFSGGKKMALFYDVLDRILVQIGGNKDIVNKMFIQKAFFFLLKVEDKEDLVEYSCLNQATHSIFKESKNNWMNHFDAIIELMASDDNEEFFLFFFSKIKEFHTIALKTEDWRKQIVLFKALGAIPQYITLNYLKYINYDEVLLLLFGLAKEFLSTQRNFLLEQEIMKFIAKMIPYAQSRKEIIEYIRESIILSKSYYRRRLSVYFLEVVFEKCSRNFMKEFNLYQNSIDLLKDRVLLHRYAMIKLFTQQRIKDDEIKVIIIGFFDQGDSSIKALISKYKQMFEDNSINEPYQIQENLKLIQEKNIKEVETKVMDNIKNNDICPIKKKKTKVKINTTALSSLKKAPSKGTIISSKLIQKIDDNPIQLNERKSSTKPMLNTIQVIVSNDIKNKKYLFKSTTPKALTELKCKK